MPSQGSMLGGRQPNTLSPSIAAIQGRPKRWSHNIRGTYLTQLTAHPSSVITVYIRQETNTIFQANNSATDSGGIDVVGIKLAGVGDLTLHPRCGNKEHIVNVHPGLSDRMSKRGTAVRVGLPIKLGRVIGTDGLDTSETLRETLATNSSALIDQDVKGVP